MSSSPGLALGTLGDADQPRVVQPLLGQHLGRDGDLPLAAVDDEQIGSRKLAGDDPRAAPRQRLAHRRVVVAARARGATLKRRYSRRLQRKAVEDHARGDRALAHRVRDVEAFDPLRRGGQAERRLQRGEPVVLRRLLRELLADREARVLHGHREPDPPLAAGVVDDLDALPRLGGEHLRERRMIGRVRHDDRRGHRPLDVVLLEKRGNDLGQLARVRMLRKERAVADVAPAADHHDVDGDEPLLRRRRDDVDVAGRRALDELPCLQLRRDG